MLTQLLENIRIVLVAPTHPGNIGATARAMKNMGLTDLCLVTPQEFPSEAATVRASGADDVLANARVVNDLCFAFQDCHWIYGTSARIRSLEKSLVSPRECATTIVRERRKAAIVFGRERFGLTNEELSLCHQHIVIPSDETFSSLNLAAAVQIVAYELRMAALESLPITQTPQERELASADQVLGFYQHLEKTLIDIDFIDPKQPRLLMQRLRRLYNRALLDITEVNILHGILSRMDRVIEKTKS